MLENIYDQPTYQIKLLEQGPEVNLLLFSTQVECRSLISPFELGLFCSNRYTIAIRLNAYSFPMCSFVSKGGTSCSDENGGSPSHFFNI